VFHYLRTRPSTTPRSTPATSATAIPSARRSAVCPAHWPRH